MSNLRRLLTKSAPKEHLHLPNHGSTEEQLLAIQAQRERTELHQENFAKFSAKIKSQKTDSKNERHKMQWLCERKTLFDERNRAQTEVDIMWDNLDKVFTVSSPSPQHHVFESDKSDVPIFVAMKSVRI
jgi:thiamine biosynthesis protein ThiC